MLLNATHKQADLDGDRQPVTWTGLHPRALSCKCAETDFTLSRESSLIAPSGVRKQLPATTPLRTQPSLFAAERVQRRAFHGAAGVKARSTCMR